MFECLRNKVGLHFTTSNSRMVMSDDILFSPPQLIYNSPNVCIENFLIEVYLQQQQSAAILKQVVVQKGVNTFTSK